MGVLDVFKRRKGEKLVDFLKTNISKESSLSDIIDIFEQMCKFPIKEDMILFETGTFDFTGNELFYFSLVRQFSNGKDEYFQIHVDVQYAPNPKNANLKGTVWDFDIDENIFEYIRNSKACSDVIEDKYVNVEIYMDET